MATIERRRGRHGLRYRVKVRVGGTAQSATFASLPAARHWASLTEATCRAQRLFPASEATRHTLGALLERYAREVLPRKSPGTQRHQGTHLAWWQTHLGAYRLQDVTPARLVACREQLAHGRAPGTVQQYLATLAHACAVAVREWQWLDESPMRKVTKPTAPRGRVRCLSADERHRLLEACKASGNPYLYLVVVLALSTGARKMELLTLTWREVDLPRGVITVPKTKNGERRVLPLAGPALALLQQHARVRRIDTPLVFPWADGRHPLDIRYAWTQAVQAAQITDFRFHDLRHSCASYLAMNGASLLEIAELLGHKTLAMVQRYAHLTESHLHGVVTRMNAAIFG
jgi:integrase